MAERKQDKKKLIARIVALAVAIVMGISVILMAILQ